MPAVLSRRQAAALKQHGHCSLPNVFQSLAPLPRITLKSSAGRWALADRRFVGVWRVVSRSDENNCVIASEASLDHFELGAACSGLGLNAPLPGAWPPWPPWPPWRPEQRVTSGSPATRMQRRCQHPGGGRRRAADAAACAAPGAGRSGRPLVWQRQHGQACVAGGAGAQRGAAAGQPAVLPQQQRRPAGMGRPL